MAMEKEMIAGEVPVSPFSRLFSMPGLDCFNIVTIGFKNEANPSAFIEGLKNTLLNHPRFSSILETGFGENKAKWIPTKVKVEDHVVFPEIDPTIENPDQFLEDYTSNMVFSPIDMSKPLWEMHILNMKTSDAESLLVARFHHSLGDGMSLMSLLLACSRKTSDLEALPTLVAPKKSTVTNVRWSLVARLWLIIKLMCNTFVEVYKFLLILCSVRDAAAPLMEKPSATLSPNKFIHRVISLGDVKFVKNAMNMMRSENDIFEYVRRAKKIMDRKKLSLEPLFSYVLLKLTMEVFGFKALRTLAMRIFGRSTIILSNVAGPSEEIRLFDHQVSYVAASISGFPQALIVHITSYVNKVIINLGVDLDVIPDPHHLCDHMVEALKMMKSAAEEKCSTDLNV
ncbi:hypothetical protein HA466_0294860 [Hirschfeldia incana]|nr:hypothetical protein HA466_0294860 [Hirschfeldia incana]